MVSKTRKGFGPMHDVPEMSDLLKQAAQLAADHLQERGKWQDERLQLIEEKTWLRAIIDEVPDYLFVKDSQCRFVVANRALADDVGRDPISIIGATDAELHPAERADEFLSDDRQVVTTGIPLLDKEEFIIRPNGELRWLSTSKVPLRNEGGAIIGLVGVARDVTLRKQAEEQVRFLAYYDPLTRLPNRANFEQNLRNVAHSLGSDSEARLMLIDLDRFKLVNDTLGHAAGDELLRQVAGRLTALVEERGQIARLGGDEFVALVSFDSDADERAFYDRLVGCLAEFEIMGNHVHVGASMGVSKVHDSITPLVALRQADIALYEAKGAGRNRWKLFESEMADKIEHRHQLEADLRNALPGGDQFVVHYQPIFDIQGSNILGAEALVRWLHPELGILGPDQFIALAEEQGLIIDLGDVVFRRACEFLACTDLAWVAVNVSPVQLRDPLFPDRALNTLVSLGISPSRLQLEITEGVLLEERDDARQVLDRLRAAGMRIAIDDFGTGYSSLSYLGRMSVDKIKIDRAFVRSLGERSGDAIVRAVIAFAKSLNMTVTAEGVETEQQQRFLEDAECDELQGYLMSRPLPEGQFHDIMTSIEAKQRRPSNT